MPSATSRTRTRSEWWTTYASPSAMTAPIGPIREHPQARAFLRDMMDEVVRVARAQG